MQWDFYPPGGYYVSPTLEAIIRRLADTVTSVDLDQHDMPGTPIYLEAGEKLLSFGDHEDDRVVVTLIHMMAAINPTDRDHWELRAAMPQDFGRSKMVVLIRVERIEHRASPAPGVVADLMGLKPSPVAAAIFTAVTPPTAIETVEEADKARELVLSLPEGLLNKLYVDLYEGRGMRIESARFVARVYMSGLKKGIKQDGI